MYYIYIYVYTYIYIYIYIYIHICIYANQERLWEFLKAEVSYFAGQELPGPGRPRGHLYYCYYY